MLPWPLDRDAGDDLAARRDRQATGQGDEAFADATGTEHASTAWPLSISGSTRYLACWSGCTWPPSSMIGSPSCSAEDHALAQPLEAVEPVHVLAGRALPERPRERWPPWRLERTLKRATWSTPSLGLDALDVGADRELAGQVTRARLIVGQPELGLDLVVPAVIAQADLLELPPVGRHHAAAGGQLAELVGPATTPVVVENAPGLVADDPPVVRKHAAPLVDVVVGVEGGGGTRDDLAREPRRGHPRAGAAARRLMRRPRGDSRGFL